MYEHKSCPLHLSCLLGLPEKRAICFVTNKQASHRTNINLPVLQVSTKTGKIQKKENKTSQVKLDGGILMMLQLMPLMQNFFCCTQMCT